MAGYLGNDYVFSMKLIPTHVNILIDSEERIRSQIRKLLEITKGCVLEIILKDILTLKKSPEGLARIIGIIKSEIDRFHGL